MNLSILVAKLNEMIIKLSKCVLRPWRVEDAVCLAKHANNAKIAANLRDAFPHPYTIKDAGNWIAAMQQQLNNLVLAIEINGEVCGGIGMHRFTDVDRMKAEVGYWLSEDYWGKGIVSEAVPAFVKHIFATTDLIRLQAGVFQHNKASMKVLEKAGFSLEAIHKKAIIKNNQILDEYIYVIFR